MKSADLQDLWDAGMEETIPAGNGTAMAQEQQTEVEADELSDGNTKFSIREEDPPKKTGIAYKVFFEKNGKLYPPMVANPGGADTPVGVWLNADVGAAAPPSKTGRLQVKAGGKGTQGGSGSLAFRPGWHLGDIPKASQFNRLNKATGVKELFPYNFVWAECEYAMDVDYQEEAMSYGYNASGKFQHSLAGLPRLPVDGYYHYRTNPDPSTVPWVITGAMKVNKILSRAEVDEILRENGVEPTKWQGPDGEQMEADDEVKQFSLRYVDDNPVVWVDENILDGKPEGMSDKTFIKNYLVSRIDDVYTIIESGYKVKQAKQFPAEYLYSKSAQKTERFNRTTFKGKLKMVTGIGEMIEIATNRRWEKTKHTGNKNAKYGVYRYDSGVAFQRGNKISAYSVELVILNADDGQKYLYDIVNIKKDDVTAKGLMDKARGAQEYAQQTNVVKSSVAQFAEDVNRENQEQFSARDKTDAVSVREYLAGMTPKSYMNNTEVELLRRYQTKLKALQEKQRAGLMRLFRHFVHASPAVLPHAPPPHWLIGFSLDPIVHGKNHNVMACIFAVRPCERKKKREMLAAWRMIA